MLLLFLRKRNDYNAFNVYCRELAPGVVSLTGDRAQGDDSKHWRDNSTVVPTKSDSDVILCLQSLLSKTLTCTLHLS